ncbi:pentaheme c-type cytochrome TorC [uncultured Endozoicomonas sp.]|uniref:pentaheme c-type cytochrome TorC n=1 Tax=uncultured Endozoicomonas sp. TaxID=432652 RepID=UPI00260D5A85|nr:pentaheme c-type cytochrome TorC [uncultured Endozoicomonas sp.]
MQLIRKAICWLLDIWKTLSKPAKYLSLGTIAIASFLMGIIFWGGFNTVLELTNTEAFCISCHSMRDTVYPELQETVHWSNHSGVRATCPDCHVPHNWTHKIARKMQASKEVWGAIFGTIDTPEKFEAKRIELASHEWARLSANNSLECKNCHSYASMKWEDMSPLAQKQMKAAAERDQSCIDCHKGIAHHLPVTDGRSHLLLSAVSVTIPEVGKNYYAVLQKPLFMDATSKEEAGVLNVATEITVTDKEKDRVKFRLEGWRKRIGTGRIINEDFGINIREAELIKEAAQSDSVVQVLEEKVDDVTGLTWQKVIVDIWTGSGELTDNVAGMWDFASTTYRESCSQCHSQPEVAHFDANTWPGMFNGMIAFVNMDDDTQNLVLKYLQLHSSTYADPHHAGRSEQEAEQKEPADSAARPKLPPESVQPVANR